MPASEHAPEDPREFILPGQISGSAIQGGAALLRQLQQATRIRHLNAGDDLGEAEWRFGFQPKDQLPLALFDAVKALAMGNRAWEDFTLHQQHVSGPQGQAQGLFCLEPMEFHHEGAEFQPEGLPSSEGEIQDAFGGALAAVESTVKGQQGLWGLLGLDGWAEQAEQGC